MAELNRRTLALYDALTDDGVEFEMHRHGLMFLFLEERQLLGELRELQHVSAFGLPAPQPLSRPEVLSLEPGVSEQVVGGILLPAERHIEPQSLTLGLRRHLEASGVEFRTGLAVTSFEAKGGQVLAALAGGERVGGDLFVLAAGAMTGRLAASLGRPLPIQAGKGYSLTFPAGGSAFRHALYFGDTKAVLSQFDKGLRVAGTMEFSGLNERLDARRIAGLRAAVRRYLGQDFAASGGSAWVGMRPMTPDGLPVIGRLRPWRNAFVSTGHAANGIFMAPVSAELLADAVEGDEEAEGVFSGDRFGRLS
jgi:D-amino-acid dehydrogenase